MNETKKVGLRRPKPKPVTKRRTNLFLDANTASDAADIAVTRYGVSLSMMTNALYEKELASHRGLLKRRDNFPIRP